MKTKIIWLLWAALKGGLLFGQTVTTREYPYIEVNGYAEESVVPDEITIFIRIKERYKNKEKVTIKQQEDSLKYDLAKEGFDLNNLSLANANADLVQVNWTKKAVLAETDYMFKAIDAMQVGKVFQIAEKFMLYDAYIYKINYSKLADLKNEMRMKAAKNAKQKAEQMLGGVGGEIVRPQIVQEAIPTFKVDRETYQRMASKDVNSVI